MSSDGNSKKKPTPPWPWGIAAAMATFVVMVITLIVCKRLGVERVNEAPVLIVVAMFTIAFVAIADRKRQLTEQEQFAKMAMYHRDALDTLIRVTTELRTLRKSGAAITDAHLGKIQDDAALHVVRSLGWNAEVERERRAMGIVRGRYDDSDPWTENELNEFFGDRPLREFSDILRELVRSQNFSYINAVFNGLPSDLTVYFSRLTLTHPAEQPKEPAAAS